MNGALERWFKAADLATIVQRDIQEGHWRFSQMVEGGHSRDRGFTALRSASSDRSELYFLVQLWYDVRWAEHWEKRQLMESQPRAWRHNDIDALREGNIYIRTLYWAPRR
jgi:hypothetical protein